MLLALCSRNDEGVRERSLKHGSRDRQHLEPPPDNFRSETGSDCCVDHRQDEFGALMVEAGLVQGALSVRSRRVGSEHELEVVLYETKFLTP